MLTAMIVVAVVLEGGIAVVVANYKLLCVVAVASVAIVVGVGAFLNERPLGLSVGGTVDGVGVVCCMSQLVARMRLWVFGEYRLGVSVWHVQDEW
jgi:hypothetical protein